jgi:hypothetical protein
VPGLAQRVEGQYASRRVRSRSIVATAVYSPNWPARLSFQNVCFSFKSGHSLTRQ